VSVTLRKNFPLALEKFSFLDFWIVVGYFLHFVFYFLKALRGKELWGSASLFF